MRVLLLAAAVVVVVVWRGGSGVCLGAGMRALAKRICNVGLVGWQTHAAAGAVAIARRERAETESR